MSETRVPPANKATTLSKPLCSVSCWVTTSWMPCSSQYPTKLSAESGTPSLNPSNCNCSPLSLRAIESSFEVSSASKANTLGRDRDAMLSIANLIIITPATEQPTIFAKANRPTNRYSMAQTISNSPRQAPTAARVHTATRNRHEREDRFSCTPNTSPATQKAKP